MSKNPTTSPAVGGIGPPSTTAILKSDTSSRLEMTAAYSGPVNHPIALSKLSNSSMKAICPVVPKPLVSLKPIFAAIGGAMACFMINLPPYGPSVGSAMGE